MKILHLGLVGGSDMGNTGGDDAVDIGAVTCVDADWGGNDAGAGS